MSSVQSILEPRLVPETPSFRGLCSTCEHTRYCTFPRDSEHPVVQCEEFDDRVEVGFATVRPLTGEGWKASQKASAYWGLCSNCEHVDSCTFPRPGGGVWQCEEYR